MINYILAVAETAAAGAAIGGPVGAIIGAVIGVAILGIGIYHTTKAIKENQAELNAKEEELTGTHNQWADLTNEINGYKELTGWSEAQIQAFETSQKRNDKYYNHIDNAAEENAIKVKNQLGDNWLEKINVTTPANKNPNETDEEKKEPTLTPDIEDKTEENITETITPTTTVDEWKQWAEEQQKKVWEREDKIRKETQEREDNAYQRAVADMKAAGINVGLFSGSIQAAQSGGGITQASQLDMSGILNQMDIDTEELQQLLDQAFEGDEENKNRVMELVGDLIQLIGIALISKGKK